MSNPTTSHLPELTSPYPLTPEQIASYQRDGHILLRGVASTEEVAAYRPVIEDAALRYNQEKRALQERDTYGKAFLQTINLRLHDEGVQRFTLAQRFARIAAALMGVERVRIFADQALFKEPGGGPTPWHQDQFYWPLDTNKTITMWMPLVDVSVDMGVMSFVPGSQEKGYLGEYAISDESEATFTRMIAENGLTVVPGQSMVAGDATFHSGWTLHKAPGNDTDRMRTVMTVIYFADGARVSQPVNAPQWDNLRTHLPGCQPGDLAASPQNPLI